VPEHLVLFDFDGTLTLPREAIDSAALKALYKLWEACSTGIVTGSTIEHVEEQLGSYLKDPKYTEMWEDMLFLPCNGTQQWGWEADVQEFRLIRGANMIDKLGEYNYRRLISYVLELQCTLIRRNESVPLTGEFIQYRDSMVNWCPIGRAAGTAYRKQFKELDAKHNIRTQYLRDLNAWLAKREIEVTCARGGNTSFDIYPTGWNKSYVLDHLDGGDYDIWFVGDRCTGDGNDKALYDVLPEGRRWETTGPKNTVNIILKEILPRVENNETTSFDY